MKKTLIATAVASCLMAATIPAHAQTVSDNEIRIGVLTDLSGIYSAIEGPGAVLAAQMAAKDFGGQVLGKKLSLPLLIHSLRQTSPALKHARCLRKTRLT